MRGGAGSLAQQGFLAVFPGRAKGTGEDCFGGKDRAASFFDGLNPRFCSGRSGDFCLFSSKHKVSESPMEMPDLLLSSAASWVCAFSPAWPLLRSPAIPRRPPVPADCDHFRIGIKKHRMFVGVHLLHTPFAAIIAQEPTKATGFFLLHSTQKRVYIHRKSL